MSSTPAPAQLPRSTAQLVQRRQVALATAWQESVRAKQALESMVASFEDAQKAGDHERTRFLADEVIQLDEAYRRAETQIANLQGQKNEHRVGSVVLTLAIIAMGLFLLMPVLGVVSYTLLMAVAMLVPNVMFWFASLFT